MRLCMGVPSQRPVSAAGAAAPGLPKIRPAQLLPVGGPVTLAFMWCNSCIWEIDQAQLDKPPWSGSRQHYRCPGCGGRVEWHIHGPAWRPGYTGGELSVGCREQSSRTRAGYWRPRIGALGEIYTGPNLSLLTWGAQQG